MLISVEDLKEQDFTTAFAILMGKGSDLARERGMPPENRQIWTLIFSKTETENLLCCVLGLSFSRARSGPVRADFARMATARAYQTERWRSGSPAGNGGSGGGPAAVGTR